jgi:hypothetical protein
MRRAWRRDIKERKRQRKHRRSTVAQTPTDPRTAGNNDKVWEQVTEDENLQQLLYEILTSTGEPWQSAQARLQEYLEANIQGCAAVTYPGRMYMANGDPGYPDEYCENPVAPGRGEYCELHEEE